MMVVTTENIRGYKVKEVKGVVFCLVEARVWRRTAEGVEYK